MPHRPVRAAALFAVLGLLALAVPAHAGWSAARTSSAPANSVVVGAAPNGGGEVAVGGVGLDARYFGGSIALASGARLGPFTPTLTGLTGVHGVAADGSGGAAIAYAHAMGNGLAVIVRDRGGTYGAPIVLEAGPYLVTRLRMDMNDRGDLAIAWTGGSATPGIKLVVRPRGGAPETQPVIGDPAASPTLTGIDLNERGDLVVGWIGPSAHAQVRGADGAFSPVVSLGTAGSTPFTTAVAIDDRGDAVAAAIVSGATTEAIGESSRGELRVAQRRAGRAWGGARVLDQRADGDELAAAAAGRHAVVAWAGPGLRGPLNSPSRIRIAARRGATPLRRSPMRAVGAGDSGVSRVAAAVGPTGTAAVLGSVGGAIRAYTRAAGRRSFGAPRVLSPLSGGMLPLLESGGGASRPVDVAGRRVVAAWVAIRGGLQVRTWRAGGREWAPRATTHRPRATSTPALLDRRTSPPLLRSAVRCDRPCRISISARIRGRRGSVLIGVSRVLPRGGRASIAEPLTAAQAARLERLLDRGRISSATGYVAAATRSGSTLTRQRPLTFLPALPAAQ